MAERRNPVLMGNGMGAGMGNGTPPAQGGMTGPGPAGGTPFGDTRAMQGNRNQPRDPLATADKLAVGGLSMNYEDFIDYMMDQQAAQGLTGPYAYMKAMGMANHLGMTPSQVPQQQAAAPAQQSLPPSNDPAAVPDIYGSSEGDAWSNYMNLARQQTTGLNQMPGVFSEYEGVPADDAAASAMFHEGSQVPDYWNAVINQTLRPPRRQRPGQMGGAGGMGTGGYGTGQY